MSAREPNGVDYSSSSSTTYIAAAQQPVSMYRDEGGAPGEDNQAATSSTGEHEKTAGKLKNKKRQPKYRATKRPPSERRFQCDHCESKSLCNALLWSFPLMHRLADAVSHCHRTNTYCHHH